MGGDNSPKKVIDGINHHHQFAKNIFYKIFGDANLIKKIIPDSVSVQVSTHHGGNPYLTPEDFKGYDSAIKAYKDSFGIDPIPQKDGGSIPIVPMFESILGIKTVLMGFGLDSDAIHSPDENYGVKNFFIGIDTIQNFYKHFGN